MYYQGAHDETKNHRSILVTSNMYVPHLPNSRFGHPIPLQHVAHIHHIPPKSLAIVSVTDCYFPVLVSLHIWLIHEAIIRILKQVDIDLPAIFANSVASFLFSLPPDTPVRPNLLF